MTTLLNVEEAAGQLRCTPWFLRRELNAGNLRGSKIGGHWRIPAEAVEEYVTAHSNVQQPTRPARRRRRRSA